MVGCARLGAFGQLADERFGADGLDLNREVRGIEAPDVEQVVHEVVEAVHLAIDEAEHLMASGGVPAIGIGEQGGGGPLDDGKWGFELLGGAGERLAAGVRRGGPGGGWRRGGGIAGGRRRCAPRGDIHAEAPDPEGRGGYSVRA